MQNKPTGIQHVLSPEEMWPGNGCYGKGPHEKQENVQEELDRRVLYHQRRVENEEEIPEEDRYEGMEQFIRETVDNDTKFPDF